MFTKTGNIFLNSDQYAYQIAQALRTELGASHQATKTLMRWTNAAERTAKNWLAGSSGPRGEHLVAIVMHSDAALDAFLSMAKRPHASISVELPLLRQRLVDTVAAIDALSSSTRHD
nr:hypothetical protein [Pseudomonas nitroreducens]